MPLKQLIQVNTGYWSLICMKVAKINTRKTCLLGLDGFLSPGSLRRLRFVLCLWILCKDLVFRSRRWGSTTFRRNQNQVTAESTDRPLISTHNDVVDPSSGMVLCGDLKCPTWYWLPLTVPLLISFGQHRVNPGPRLVEGQA